MSTQAYVDLMFAWGHARLGDQETARRLVAEADELLRPFGDRAHAWLLGAFTYRIEQAAGGAAHGGLWPESLSAGLRTIDERLSNQKWYRYVVDRLRALSRILEPDERIDPYLPWKVSAPSPHPLEDLLNRGSPRVAQVYEEQIREAESSGDPIQAGRFHHTMLQFRGAIAALLADSILTSVEAFATASLTRGWANHPDASEWFRRHRPKSQPGDGKKERRRYHADAANPGAWVEDAIYRSARDLLESALEFSAAAGGSDWVQRLTDRFVTLQLGSELAVNARRRLGAITSRLSWILIRLGLRESAASVCDRLRVESFAVVMDGGPDEPMSVCLAFARLNSWLGCPGPAGWVLDRTRERLPRIETPAVQADVIVDAIELISRLEWTAGAAQLDALLGALPWLPNPFTTATHFSRFHVVIAEAFILAITTSNFGPPADVLRPMSKSEIAARREALAAARGRLVEWGRPDWGPATKS